MNKQLDRTWVAESPNGVRDAPPAVRSSTRIPHTKSRNGCKSCKQKRIKCDESKPVCAQCAHRKISCEYPQAEPPNEQLETPSPRLEHSISRELARTKLLDFMKESSMPCDQLANPKYKRIHAVELLDHWFDADYPWIGTTEVQNTMQKHGFNLGLGAPCLLHGILAFAACHLNYLQPGNLKYEIASTIHYNRSLALYSNQISTHVGADNADQLFGTWFLLGPMTFWNLSRPSDQLHLESHGDVTAGSAEPATKDPFSHGDFTWLRALQGTRILQDDPAIQTHLKDSIWAPIFLEAREWEADVDMSNDSQTDSDVYQNLIALKELCDVQADSSSTDNPYQHPIQRLGRLSATEPHRDMVGWYMVWVGKLSPEFLNLLEESDPKALLILAYWCALILRINFWWITRSAKQQCTKVCTYLDQFSEPGVQNLLEFPASACGYRLEN
ncbi:uncharacterized protein BDZ99DRAFT_508916 [Mytilinidion resinicola]|uniref:Zn(2)-C6 fungal-type domain-containing protein n=1 Tax=Mytilinidion resinicola TaxID=574789 RepID=A0A6A6YP46_9PEZI|nr:uncharacterized protein BDZ99DRAFT_508916 [Mytilinidion resinicola]KAF2810521.1 hypothetical protein BDZ99DRAFT_508916 [Mytilinidion resinicola]